MNPIKVSSQSISVIFHRILIKDMGDSLSANSFSDETKSL